MTDARHSFGALASLIGLGTSTGAGAALVSAGITRISGAGAGAIATGAAGGVTTAAATGAGAAGALTADDEVVLASDVVEAAAVGADVIGGVVSEPLLARCVRVLPAGAALVATLAGSRAAGCRDAERDVGVADPRGSVFSDRSVTGAGAGSDEAGVLDAGTGATIGAAVLADDVAAGLAGNDAPDAGARSRLPTAMDESLPEGAVAGAALDVCASRGDIKCNGSRTTKAPAAIAATATTIAPDTIDDEREPSAAALPPIR